MHDAIKIAIGAGATAALALLAHGPLGKGAAFVAMLQHRAGDALVAHGLSAQGLHFQTSPLSRAAILGDTLPDARRSEAAAIVNAVPGVAFTRWGDGTMATAGAPISETEDAGPEPRFSAPVAAEVDNDSAPHAPAEAEQSPEVARCQDGIDKAVAGRALLFRSGSAWLNPTSRRIIADVAATLKACPALMLEIGGHTDSRGSEAVNKAMSDERARRVRDELIAQGVSANAVTARGYGSAVPLQRNNPLAPANRRIAFTVTKGGN